MEKAVLMARVSSDEQAKGYSLDVQQEALKRYCQLNNIEVVYTFKEDHSAKSFERPEFKQFLTYAKKHKNDIDLLLFTSWDRFSRNTADAYDMIRRLNALEIQPQAIEQPIDFAIPENKAMLAFYLAIPEIENDRRSIKITGGIRAAWKAGRWTHMAPKGYKNSRDDQNKPLIIKNEEAQLIEYMFKEIAKGTTQAEVKIALAKKGMKVSKAHMSRLLRNPLYMAKIPIPAMDDEQAYLTEAVHEAIVTEKLYWKVQDILDENFTKRNLPKKTVQKEELPLRGIVNCSHCGNTLTGSGSRSRTKRRYFYYHCHHCKQERHSAPTVNDKFVELLQNIQLNQGAQELYQLMIKKLLDTNKSENTVKKNKLNDELVKQQQRLNNLQELLLDKKLEAEDYAMLKSKIEKDMRRLKTELSAQTQIKSTYEQYLEKGISFINNVGKLYEQGTVSQKQKIAGSIFPENFSFSENKFRTTRINQALLYIVMIDKGLWGKNKADIVNNIGLFRMVESEGFEPSSGEGNKRIFYMLSWTLFFREWNGSQQPIYSLVAINFTHTSQPCIS